MVLNVIYTHHIFRFQIIFHVRYVVEVEYSGLQDHVNCLACAAYSVTFEAYMALDNTLSFPTLIKYAVWISISRGSTTQKWI